ncbi:23S rRNA (adenine(2030)-N(6))-methyltransferase RlmJ [Pseudooceanicola sp. C21-150M6]|uniref:23S rRNA (adenine(2030)-N(6))-methyltransferase RlmJ n=1 Tax=Pseudooceanicola sp. C21-150M6 TaxID=3434355 RepID=UPI003D7FE72E
MLSYQHLYHAGNPADVHKHALLAWMLARLTEKPKPLSYIETHAGRGLYDLTAAEAVKTGEAAAGVGRMLGSFAADHPYVAVLDRVRAAHGAAAYPGSPLIASDMLRVEDSLHLAELHPQEHAALERAVGRRAKVHRQDGFELAMSLAPPEPRRGLMLIDPSFEVKADYDTIPKFIGRVHRAWNVGIIALWYPILKDARHRGMVRGIEAQGLPKLVKSEVSFPPVREGHGMVGSGLTVVNAPFGLEEEAGSLAALFARTS